LANGLHLGGADLFCVPQTLMPLLLVSVGWMCVDDFHMDSPPASILCKPWPDDAEGIRLCAARLQIPEKTAIDSKW
jgi:hypothetical protein